MSRLFAGLAAMALLCITHAALAAPAAARQRGFGADPPRPPAPPAARLHRLQFHPPQRPRPRRPRCSTTAPPAAPPLGSSGCAACSRHNSTSAGCAASRRNAAIKRGGRHHTSQAEKEEAPLRALRLLRISALPREAVLPLAPAFLVAVQTAALSLPPPAAARVLLPAPLALVAELFPAAAAPAATNFEPKRYCVGSGQPEG